MDNVLLRCGHLILRVFKSILTMSPAETTSTGVLRTRPLEDEPELGRLAATLLRTSSATLDLSEEEARRVVAYLRLVHFPRGATLIREGDRNNTSFMLLLLSGDVSVDMADEGKPETLAISVLGPGNLIGEMGLLDGAPRSATCRAVSDVQAAGLSRQDLQRLIDEHPKVAARLLVAISQRIGDRLRAMGEQLRLYARLTAAQQMEIDRLKLRLI